MDHSWTKVIALTASFAGLFASNAVAQNRWVTIANETGYTMVEFYSAQAAAPGWGTEILGDLDLRNDGRVDINFDDGTENCLFNFRAVFQDGGVVESAIVDVCKIGAFTFN